MKKDGREGRKKGKERGGIKSVGGRTGQTLNVKSMQYNSANFLGV